MWERQEFKREPGDFNYYGFARDFDIYLLKYMCSGEQLVIKEFHFIFTDQGHFKAKLYFVSNPVLAVQLTNTATEFAAQPGVKFNILAEEMQCQVDNKSKIACLKAVLVSLINVIDIFQPLHDHKPLLLEDFQLSPKRLTELVIDYIKARKTDDCFSTSKLEQKLSDDLLEKFGIYSLKSATTLKGSSSELATACIEPTRGM